MSAQRRPSGPIRQLSLQQHHPRRQQIRRQRSADDEKPLQIYSNSIRTKFCPSPKSDNDRPKIRIAWGEQRSKSTENQVEIVARQIPSKSRPPTARNLKISRPLITEKATILYSRQELAERLRLAWKQREANKSNIDIFLAHNTVEERSDSQLSYTTTPSTPISIPNTNSNHDEINSKNSENEKIEIQLNETEIKNEEEEEEEEESDQQMEEDQIISYGKSCFNYKQESLKISSYQTSNRNKNSNENLKDENDSINEEKLNSPTIEKKKSCINIDWNITGDEIQELKLPSSSKEEEVISSAKLKRASFQSGLNKAFVGPIIEKTMTLKVAEKSKFRRTNSAPPIRRPMSVSSNRNQINIVIDSPPIIKNELNERKDILNVLTNDNNEPSIKNAISHRPIKSAPIKRRTKSGKRRGLTIGSKNDNDNHDNRRRGKAFLENRITDIVTMVSLISSADSDSDVDENSLRDDKLIHELRNKLPTTSIIKSSTNPAITNNRRPIKSVSFQQDSFDDDSTKNEPIKEEKNILLIRSNQSSSINRGNSRSPTPEETITTTTTWKTEISKLVPSLPSLIQENEINIPLTDREKRCLVVPISDLRDKKRKLLRTKSTPPKPGEMIITSKIESNSSRHLQNENTQQPIILIENPIKIAINHVNTTPEISVSNEIPEEPPCQTAKEKECWHLYRRMCDKGVYVSFDTVLRGMLTPTEYRLRQKQISQNC
ncbi:rho GTPase-activating protein gacF isoform X2 [Leptopilina boulardi]|uniref:rho GTPase-activating protein gacF isoform X2 n=1 Tax=Leptopilina boulardi TaxID=63433 RepID=UPI0021F5AAA1|nr:rho GTPase-activating protein gacF isoform X2 [Leptopilina boulardi]